MSKEYKSINLGQLKILKYFALFGIIMKMKGIKYYLGEKKPDNAGL